MVISIKGWKKLKKIDLAENKIGEEGGAGLGKNTIRKNLEKLIINEKILGDKGALMIALNAVWMNLKHLDLSNNNSGSEVGMAFGKNKFCTTIKLEIKLYILQKGSNDANN